MDMMQLGKSDLLVSRIILGTWATGGENWGPFNEEDAVQAVQAALDGGINTIDTAPAYGVGRAEELLGRLLEGKRQNIVIATKGGLNMSKRFPKDLSPQFLEEDLHNSLRRLRTDYIDLYQCHWPDPATPLEDTLAAMVRFREQGKIRHIGLCNYGREELMAAMKLAPIVSLQPQYSLLKRDIEEEIIGTCIDTGTDIISYGSLGAGMLTGKYSKPGAFEKTDVRSFFYKHFKARYWPAISDLLETMKIMAAGRNASPGNIALAWILSRRGISAAIVGARNSSQVQDNLLSLAVQLTDDEIGELDRLSALVYAEGNAR
ncbi:MAG: aldo/keto reductase [Spirochaetae bacterium HGW-Spirochaetae-1]|jgi:aryl-alcohol dehydrogenase-like predicted oxidoreductase|nr:MAG: aldo/keto reductase [Spirochaetae bacterium HGW-Spirochaetae-1]